MGMTTLNDVMIIELLDRHSVDDFDDLLIEIMWHMKEQKELRERDDEEDRWNFTRTFTNTRRYPLHILQRLRTGMILKESGWLLDVKKILWNRSPTT